MQTNQIYAVVDLETTGSSLTNDNRIIQFSCVLLEKEKIIDNFNLFINPGKKLDEHIKKLTRISDEDLQDAPYFEDVAGTIYSILQGTIFVAHNVEFDYRFLNYELERAGYPTLEIKAFDTVQLAQILFPTLESYRLSDLAKKLAIKHLRPHQADSDTYVTAKLFLKLIRRAQNLPYHLQQQLSLMSDCLLYDTTLFFKQILAQSSQEKKLPADLLQADTLILQRPKYKTYTNEPLEYPVSAKEKKQILANILDERMAQFVLMNDVYDFLNFSSKKQLVIEAPTGIGKTLGYLFAAAYLTTQGKKIVISTATTALQKQLLTGDLAKLQEILPFKITALQVKASQNYLDLAAFAKSLQEPQPHNSRLLQMKILVWLTQTQTGDLAELNLTNHQIPLFAEIIHRGLDSLGKDNPFYSLDFVNRQNIKQQQADILITNHAYLLQYTKQLAKLADILILDEAQSFQTIALNTNKETLDLDEIKILADTLLVKMQSHVSLSFAKLIANRFLDPNDAKELIFNLQIVDHSSWQLRSLIFEAFLVRQIRTNDHLEIALTTNKFKGFIKAHLGLIKKVKKAYLVFEQLNWRLKKQFYRQANDRLNNEERQFFYEYFSLSEKLAEQMQQFSNLELDCFEQKSRFQSVWLSYASMNPNAHLRINFGVLESQNYLDPQIYSKFAKTLLIGAGMILPKDLAYTRKNFDLASDTDILQYPEIFDYQKQACAILIKDAPDISNCSTQDYIEYLSEVLIQIACNLKRQTLVLFNSLETIAEVYTKLEENGVLGQRIILAQGITGGVEKIKKRFILDKDKHCILLATGSFWEGIDFPKDQLELLVITRLPFQSLDQSFNKIRYQKAKWANQNPFTTIALPEALLKFKQGFGRLIRTNSDYGACLILDARIFTKNYGYLFRNVLPATLPQIKCSTSESLQKLKSFYENVEKL